MKKWLGILKVLHEVTDYPMSIISKIAQQRLNDSQSKNNETNETSNKIQLILTYSGKQGKKLKKKMKKYIRKTLTENVQVIVTYQSKKLSTKFNVKDKSEFYRRSNLLYFGKWPNQTRTEDYIGEADCRIKERIIDHGKRDNNSHILKHCSEEGHTHLWNKDFKVLSNNYCLAFKWKFSEALFIKQLKPSLNVKENSIWLHLNNWLLIYDATYHRF